MILLCYISEGNALLLYTTFDIMLILMDQQL